MNDSVTIYASYDNAEDMTAVCAESIARWQRCFSLTLILHAMFFGRDRETLIRLYTFCYAARCNPNAIPE